MPYQEKEIGSAQKGQQTTNRVSVFNCLLEIAKQLKFHIDTADLRYLKNEELPGLATSWEKVLKLYNPDMTSDEIQEAYDSALADFNPTDNDKRFGIYRIKDYLIKNEKNKQEKRERDELRIYKSGLKDNFKTICKDCYDNGWKILDIEYKFKRKTIKSKATEPCKCEIGMKYMLAYSSAIDKDIPLGFNNNNTDKKETQNKEQNKNTDKEINKESQSQAPDLSNYNDIDELDIDELF